MIGIAIESYDRTLGLQRHNDNLKKFDSLFEALNKLRGAMMTCAAIGGLATAVFTILEIVRITQGK